LQAADVLPICKEMQPLFRNVTDHVRVLKEDIESMREVLSFAFEANLLTVQSEQTIISRRLAAWAAILAVPTAIAGIYGMNFENMPELKWQYGYFYVLGSIGIVCCALFAMFKRNDWI
ncbi:MAG: magnesium transporter, partial [Proteobacteria bacterium]